MESIKEADYCILVAEPTIFGLHNLKMIVELVSLFKIPFGFVINKVEDPSNTLIDDYVNSLRNEVLIKIPFTKDIADKAAKGILLSQTNKEIKDLFNSLAKKVEERIK